MFVIETSDEMEDGFKHNIFNADKCEFVKYSSQDFIKADKKLNAIYSKIMKTKKPAWGTITKEGIKETQRQWIQYRDAWVIFGAIRCPKMTSDSWRTMITKERIEQLEDFVDE
jgi:uncharacterized protein YecT (DUF1311 family)